MGTSEMLSQDQMRDAILQGHVLSVLRRLPSESVQTVITSPPYWGLRAYQTEPQVWASPTRGRFRPHEHIWGDTQRAPWANEMPGPNGRRKNTLGSRSRSAEAGAFCQWCDAWRGELGAEPTIALYVAHIVRVFREVRRVLQPGGVCWLNIGDSYAGSGNGPIGATGQAHAKTRATPRDPRHPASGPITGRRTTQRKGIGELKNKDLGMIPARAAIALQDDGWWLRSEIVWDKVSPMPESVVDRPTRAHEMIYLLSKSERYFYDAAAIAEPATSTHGSGNGFQRPARVTWQNADGTPRGNVQPWEPAPTRNCRDVWRIRSEPFAGAHFAVMPSALAARCLLAGSRPGDLVLDPFGGSGTVGRVAQQYGRHYCLVELNPEYAVMAERRCAQDNLWMSSEHTTTSEGVGA